MPAALPPCGLYRTVTAVAGIDAGRLVYFHNHGDPGPGLYLPESWANNRAKFSANGFTAPPDFDPKALRALPAEGFYRVKSAFYCCEKKCTQFEPDAFVQLGYNGNGRALVFMPELGRGGIAIPDRGSSVDDNVLSNLQLLKVAEQRDDGTNIDISLPRGFVVH
jgi:hypothetical protein